MSYFAAPRGRPRTLKQGVTTIHIATPNDLLALLRIRAQEEGRSIHNMVLRILSVALVPQQQLSQRKDTANAD